MQTAGVIKL